MLVTTERGETIPIFPRSSHDYVTVGDVQRVVIAWMRIVEKGARLQGQTAGLAEQRLIGEAGEATEVELWVWRGLVLDSEGVWSIRL
jgi:hypothetical protein